MQFSINGIPMGGLGQSMKPKRATFGVSGLITSVIIGVVFIVIGIVSIRFMQPDPTWLSAQGKVFSITQTTASSSNSAAYIPVVQYTVGGVNYTVTSNESSSQSPTIGDSAEVLYNPASPTQAKVKQSAIFSILVWLFPVVGVIIFVAGIFGFIRSRKRTARIQNLLSSGVKVQGVVSEVSARQSNNSTASSNENSSVSYIIRVSATNLSGVVQTYTSDSVVGFGALALADFRTNPIAIDVYLDPNDTTNYYVDISEIPNLTPARIAEMVASAIHTGAPTDNPQILQ